MDISEKESSYILLVENDDDLRNVITSSLQKSGFDVCHANDGSVALEILKLNLQRKYLLITDLKMPLMNGDALIAEATSLGFEFEGIIITTGEHYVGINTAKLIGEGKAKLLQKPFSTKTMLELVNKLCHG